MHIQGEKLICTRTAKKHYLLSLLYPFLQIAERSLLLWIIAILRQSVGLGTVIFSRIVHHG